MLTAQRADEEREKGVTVGAVKEVGLAWRMYAFAGADDWQQKLDFASRWHLKRFQPLLAAGQILEGRHARHRRRNVRRMDGVPHRQQPAHQRGCYEACAHHGKHGDRGRMCIDVNTHVDWVTNLRQVLRCAMLARPNARITAMAPLLLLQPCN